MSRAETVGRAVFIGPGGAPVEYELMEESVFVSAPVLVTGMSEQQVMELVEELEAHTLAPAVGSDSTLVLRCDVLGYPNMTEPEARTVTEMLHRRGRNITVFLRPETT